MPDHTNDSRIGNHGSRRCSSHRILTTVISNREGRRETFDQTLIVNGHLDCIPLQRTQLAYCS